MRILIYNESAVGKALAAELKSKGHRASVISPDPAQFDIKNLDPADEVHAWDSFIVHAYDGKAEIHYHGGFVEEVEEAEPVEESVEQEEEPVKKVRRRNHGT
jgi:hypothetical protein